MTLTRRHSLGILGAALCSAASKSLLDEWGQIASETDGVAGVCALHLGSGKSLDLHGNDRFPLASVCKLPMAINILGMVGEGKLKLTDKIEIPPYDVVPGVSQIAERWPKQKSFPLDEVVQLMVAKS